jgi:hypothetical protein
VVNLLELLPGCRIEPAGMIIHNSVWFRAVMLSSITQQQAMVDRNRIGAMRPFPFVVFSERVVIVKFTKLKTVTSSKLFNSEGNFFFSFTMVEIVG